MSDDQQLLHSIDSLFEQLTKFLCGTDFILQMSALLNPDVDIARQGEAFSCRRNSGCFRRIIPQASRCRHNFRRRCRCSYGFLRQIR